MAKRVGANQRLKRQDNRNNKKKNRPAFLRRMFGLFKIISLVLILVGSGVFVVLKSKTIIDKVAIIKVKKVLVKGNKEVKTSDIKSLAAIEQGVSLITLNVAGIKKRISSCPEVKTVKIKRRIPGTVIISIVERKPMAIANVGLMYLFDNEGIMWPIKANTYWDLPIISGIKDTVINSKKHKVRKCEMDKINTFFTKVNKIDKSFALDLSQIDFSDDDEVKVKFESKPTIVKLSRRNIQKNIYNLQKIFATIGNKEESMPKHIDLCFNNIAFVK